MATQTIAKIARYVLVFEFIVGGQCRVTKRLTPKISEIAYKHADGYKRFLPFIPGETAAEHTRNIGVLLLTAGLLMVAPSKGGVRAAGVGLGGVLSLMFLHVQRSIGVPYWLPVLNSALAGLVLYSEYF
ncbi:hypothetical protein K431DRAFT_280310 [Polychaeton citri CBS 116435]|uniref:Uncharacterized protein n=1 Tax=Polychaeton citri CBS 116435 TaxID=1314669 RepID=A0A9P4QIP8_9PEZI|nr:hypothetical protein K431DRAFT_280310 [Polychaeton citri CBS 116435]